VGVELMEICMKRVLILLLFVLVAGCAEDPRKAEEKSDFDYRVKDQAAKMDAWSKGECGILIAMISIKRTHDAFRRTRYGGVNEVEWLTQREVNKADTRTLVAAEAISAPSLFVFDSSPTIKIALELEYVPEEDVEELRDALRKDLR
jgi:hypothetical protein